MAGTRKLTLRTEHLSEITSDELAQIAAGALTGTETYGCPTYPVKDCLQSNNPTVCVNTPRCTPYLITPVPA